MKPTALLFGTGFGFVLGWARLTDYDVIRDMLLFREIDLYLMMGASVVTAAIGMRALRAIGARTWVGHSPVAWTITRPTRNHVYGSILFGLGWGIAGTCPGPVAAQLGRGQFIALFTLAGLLAGAALFGYRMQRAKHAADTQGRESISATPGL